MHLNHLPSILIFNTDTEEDEAAAAAVVKEVVEETVEDKVVVMIEAATTRALSTIKGSTVTVTALVTIIVGSAKTRVQTTSGMPLPTTQWVAQQGTANDSSGTVVII